MSVPVVVQTYDCLQAVIKNFKISTNGKNLNEVLAILEMNQLKLLSWGGTRMGNAVTAWQQFIDFRPAIYGYMYSTDIKKR